MFTLNIAISNADLATIIAAGEQVVITKQTGGAHGNVAWVAFDPLTNNSVTWEDSYVLYASNTAIQNGATIDMLSQTPALATDEIAFNGVFSGPVSGVSLQPDQYGALNQYLDNDYMVFGLAQEAQVSNQAVPASPINATVVPMNQSAVFTPLDILQVFLAADTNNGMVISSISSAALTVTFGNGVYTASIEYNSAIGGFQPVSAAAPSLRNAA